MREPENPLGSGNNSEPWYAAGLGEEAAVLSARSDKAEQDWLFMKRQTQECLPIGEPPRPDLIRPVWNVPLPGDPPPLPPAPLAPNSA